MNEGETVVELETLGCDVVLTELDLEEVVAEGDTCFNSNGDIVEEGSQEGVNGIEGAPLLLHGDELPVVLLHLLLHIILREVQLELAGFFANTGKVVSENYLATSEDGLNGGDASYGAALHHGRSHGRGQRSEGFDGQYLSEAGAKVWGNELRGVDVHLSHGTIGVEGEASSANRGEILGEGFLTLVGGGLHFETSAAEGYVVMEGGVAEGGERKRGGGLSCNKVAAYRTEG